MILDIGRALKANGRGRVSLHAKEGGIGGEEVILPLLVDTD